MGMAASQARLLSITARLSDNENSGQSLSFTKISLANQTEQLNADYNAALNKTKLTVLTGFNGSEEIYTDIGYGVLNNYNAIAGGKQYCITDKDGRMLVTQRYAEAFEQGNGDLTKFLAAFGFTKADINVTEADKTLNAEGVDTNPDTVNAEKKIHEAWDKYLTSVGLHYGDDEHSIEYNVVKDANGVAFPVAQLLDGNNTPTADKIDLNYIGTTQEQREMYDYALSLTAVYYGAVDINKTNEEKGAGLKSSAFAENVPEIKFLENIFSKMSSDGYYTYTSDAAKTDPSNPYNKSYIYSSNVENDTGTKVNKTPLTDNTVLEEMLRKGDLLLETYSSTAGKFVTTTLSDDVCIQEVEDERAIALVEAKYTSDMMKIENQDNKIDLQLKKLDTEHTALQTEYDSVKTVIDKNVEKSFNIFS